MILDIIILQCINEQITFYDNLLAIIYERKITIHKQDIYFIMCIHQTTF